MKEKIISGILSLWIPSLFITPVNANEIPSATFQDGVLNVCIDSSIYSCILEKDGSKSVLDTEEVHFNKKDAGNYVLYYQDSSNNELHSLIEFTVDTNSPEITSEQVLSYNEKDGIYVSANVHYEIKDDSSNKIEYELLNKNGDSIETGEYKNSLSLNEETKKIVFKDVFENSTTIEAPPLNGIGKQKIEIELQSSNLTSYQKEMNIKVLPYDETYTYSVDKTEGIIQNNNEFTLTKNGTYTFSVKTEENIYEQKSIVISNIDSQAPILLKESINTDILAYNHFFCKNDSIQIVLDMKEESGIDIKNTYLILKNKNNEKIIEGSLKENTLTFQIDSFNQLYDVYLVAQDKVGNKSDRIPIGNVDDTYHPFLIDKDAPYIHDVSNFKYQIIDDKKWITKDVNLEFEIGDSQQEKVCSGIQSYKIKVNDKVVKSEEFKKEEDKDEIKKISLSTSQLEEASNGLLKIEVIATDYAQNTTTETYYLYRDTTGPILSSFFDQNHESIYYNSNRTLTIQVNEMNFDADKMNLSINKDGMKQTIKLNWNLISGKEGCKDAIWQGKYTFNEDGNYDVIMNGQDKLGFSSTETNYSFVIDQTSPVIQISYDNNSVYNHEFYNASRTMTLSITDKNFDFNDLYIEKNTKNIPAFSNWVKNGDTYTTTIYFEMDGYYSFQLKASDLAGNSSQTISQSFYIDKTPCDIQIDNIQNCQSYKENVFPVIKVTDEYLDDSSISLSLSGIKQGNIPLHFTTSKITNGYLYSLFHLEEDDIYTLNITAYDKAHNICTKTLTFTLNAKGSTYQFDENIRAILSQKYVKKVNTDLTINEINLDELSDISIRCNSNGHVNELEEGKEYTIKQSKWNGYEKYSYSLNKELFKQDGIYEIYIRSKDKAGNVNNNTNASIIFCKDETKPNISISNIEDNGVYNENKREVYILSQDNIQLKSIEVFVNNKKVYNSTKDFSYTLVLEEDNFLQNIKVKATDQTGNTYERTISNILLTTNPFLRWVYNTPLFLMTSLILASISLFILKLLRKKA